MLNYILLKSYFRSFEYSNITRKSAEKTSKGFPYIMNYRDYNHIITYKYTIKELKEVLQRMKLPKCKETKRENICEFITNIMYLSYNIVKIQKIWRNYFIRQFNKTLGPSYRNFKLSNNMDDFLTTDHICDIDYYYFFSYRDKDGFIYTFHIVSIDSLIKKNSPKNPYNRNHFDEELLSIIRRRVKYNKILKKTEQFIEYTPRASTIKDRVNGIFHHMDQLGNYTSSRWLLDLNTQQIYRFIFELYEIWNFRAQLTHQVKEMICPPRGNPFASLPRNFIANYNNQRFIYSNNLLLQSCVRIMEVLAYSAHTDENKKLGVLYILSALTLVSSEARNALPWLYASVYYN